ncbi:non-homologous end-joining DNA ligase [Streptoalloteichus hindustanus]|uniref:DNA ligase (ATP) n=1 Tax=Streptoalloteichus hindustanus TaxID=2017 RepID=A0A1M5DJY6_STRHI|nr:non-homologous end-joining DNA ligase [Streptoalloteichus hindustanus]SHF67338.1 bifunctional non-homologous end joining protein LigD [Streptoalloteichus hindustanus]
MGDLSEYRRRRDPRRTPEPVPAEPVRPGRDELFVIQEHHARRLHWDVRLERGGVLVSWAVPKGLPPDPEAVRLAVRTEDHPLEYADFEGTIPAGEYGAGRMLIWDRGRYETVKWGRDEVSVVLHGDRVRGRYVFLRRTRGGGEREEWLVRRADPPQEPDWEPLPASVAPMLATAGGLPPAEQDPQWAYEFKWDGARALVRVEGGRVTITSRLGNDVTRSYPELRALGESLGATQVVLDGEIVAFAGGRPSFSALQRRMHVTGEAQARRLATAQPVTYLVFDLLHLDGRSCLELPYSQRRRLLEGLELAGPRWQTPPSFPGQGAAVLRASREQGLEGVVAKRLSSRYQPGRRSPDWIKIAHVRTQEVVVGGWRPGQGRRAETVGALLCGVPVAEGLRFVGSVGTGFTDADLARLAGLLARRARASSPFAEPLPAELRRQARWVCPTLVGEVVFREWTRDGRMRAPSWRGLRPDKSPREVALDES